MACNERQRNGTHPHARRIKTSTGRSKQGNDIERQVLSDETGWYSVSTAYRDEGRTWYSVFWNSKFKRMSDVTDQYLLRTRLRAENHTNPSEEPRVTRYNDKEWTTLNHHTTQHCKTTHRHGCRQSIQVSGCRKAMVISS